ncbi:diguanylate cyclase [Clostridium sp.]|uniref:sensor domain-containing diguanylate cyclase n=1 Tax=Clostridium sp. TaxID=1506 RepID=UPI00359FF01A
MDIRKLKRIILDSEEILIEKILEYAKKQNYVKYTSTLKEAWRMSIWGLSESLVKVIEKNSAIPEMGPDDDFTKNEVAQFGVLEARKHRLRGVTLDIFLGLMKYYEQAYMDVIDESSFSCEEKKYFSRYIKRCFDHIELGFTIEWAGLSEKQNLEELQKSNREITNEKNKYLTIFESIYDPIILVDKDNNIENINYRAAEVFLNASVPGTKYYGNVDEDEKLIWISEEINEFVASSENEVLKEKTIETKTGEKTFLVKFKKMLDVSEKYRGVVIIFNDITERVKAENKLKIQHEQLKYYAFTDPMTGVSNRRTGIVMLEKELSLVPRRDKPLSICFIDVDGLKKINDNYGHTEGDWVINFIVSNIKLRVRKTDTVSRMGGDEFLIIFPDCCEDDAEKIIEEIYCGLKKHKKPFKCSFSYGIIEIAKHTNISVNDVIRASDEKMYKNKLAKNISRE